MATRKVAPATKAPRAAARAQKRASQPARRGPHKPETEGSIPSPATTSLPGSHLNPRQRAFVVEYLKDKSAGQAYARAYGVKASVAETTGPRLLRNAQVRAEIDRLEREALSKVQQETGITLARTLREIARVAFFDPRRLFNAKGEPVPITDLDDDTAAAIAGLDVMEEFEGSGEDRRFVGFVKKWKIASKVDGLEKLMKHLGGYKEDHDQAGNPLAERLAAFVGQIHESGAGRLPLAAKVQR